MVFFCWSLSTALAVSDDPASWAVAGDQVIITITGVDIAKIRYGWVCGSAWIWVVEGERGGEAFPLTWPPSMFWTVNSLTFQMCMWVCVRITEFGSEGWAGLDLWCAWPLYLLDHNCIKVGPSALMLFARYAIDQGCQWVRVMSYVRLMQTQWRGRAHETTEWRTVMHHANQCPCQIIV